MHFRSEQTFFFDLLCGAPCFQSIGLHELARSNLKKRLEVIHAVFTRSRIILHKDDYTTLSPSAQSPSAIPSVGQFYNISKCIAPRWSRNTSDRLRSTANLYSCYLGNLNELDRANPEQYRPLEDARYQNISALPYLIDRNSATPYFEPVVIPEPAGLPLSRRIIVPT
jgi:hypothetical protein